MVVQLEELITHLGVNMQSNSTTPAPLKRKSDRNKFRESHKSQRSKLTGKQIREAQDAHTFTESTDY